MGNLAQMAFGTSAYGEHPRHSLIECFDAKHHLRLGLRALVSVAWSFMRRSPPAYHTAQRFVLPKTWYQSFVDTVKLQSDSRSSSESPAYASDVLEWGQSPSHKLGIGEDSGKMII